MPEWLYLYTANIERPDWRKSDGFLQAEDDEYMNPTLIGPIDSGPHAADANYIIGTRLIEILGRTANDYLWDPEQFNAAQ